MNMLSMKIVKMLSVQALLTIVVLTSTPAAAEPTTFRAVYHADYKGLPVSAVGIRELIMLEPGKYMLSSSANSFLASISEHSIFSIDGQEVIPLKYHYSRGGIGKNRKVDIAFNWQEKTVSNRAGKWEMELPPGVLDKLLYQYKMRGDLKKAADEKLDWPQMSYQIADKGDLKNYIFEVVGEESIETPVGKIHTIKANRIRKNSNRTTTFWMAPEYEFMLIRLLQIEKNGKGFELLLKEGVFDGQPVRGS
ncbi:MAG: DUF3108 domain-containing protein [Pseudomonadales bacterium]